MTWAEHRLPLYNLANATHVYTKDTYTYSFDERISVITVMVAFGSYEVIFEDIGYGDWKSRNLALDYAEAVCTILIGTICSTANTLPSGQRKEAA